MKINTLRLENFQGIKSAAFDFDGQSASIYRSEERRVGKEC